MRPAMHACTTFDTHQFTVPNQCQTMTDWSLLDREWPPEPYDPLLYGINSYYPEKPPLSQCFPPQADNYLPPSPTLTLLLSPSLQHSPTLRAPSHNEYLVPKGENPREIRNKAEKQRRDKLNHSISELASMVPPVVAANRKIDKTGVLRLTAHYLRAHQYVFGDSIGSTAPEFNSGSTRAVLGLLKGFLLTTTYKGIVVVVSQNVQEYLGYTELDLFGQNILNITHQDDRQMLKEQLMPRSQLLGTHGELLIPDGQDGKRKVAEALAKEKRKFVVRLKKLSQRSEPAQYISCSVEGTLRKSDRACRGYNRCCQMVRRARARGDNPCSSGNDVVFIGVVRPTTETFMTERTLESFKMEYRTRHSIDGEIIQCEQRIALVTGYMIHEVNGVNAMNFMHRDDVRWVIIALRDMYVQNHLFGESCYRLMTRNGQFIYMRTRGRLDVDEDSRAVRSFVCTNTVVEEQEGKQLIKQMKKKFTLMANNNTDSLPASLLDDDTKKVSDKQLVPVEDPRQLEKVILHLVTNLPSPIAEDNRSITPDCGDSQNQNLPLAIIPHRKERIVSAIEKIYGVIKNFSKEATDITQNEDHNLEEILENPINPETHLKDWLTPPASSPNPQTYNENKSSQPPVEPASSLPGPSTKTREMCRQKNINRKHFYQSSISHSQNLPPTRHNRTNDIGDLDIHIKTAVSEGLRAESIHFNFPTRTPGENAPARVTYMSTSTSLKQQPRILVYTGSKRQRTGEDHETPKKKVPVSETVTRDENINTQIEQEDLEQDDLEFVAPIFNSLFDASIMGDNLSQVDSTLLSSLEQRIDPTFPDLLISEEVQDILDQIEGQKEENQMET